MKFGGAPVERPSREIQSPHAPRTLPAKISARRQRLKCAVHIRKDLIAEDIHILILIFNRRPEHWPRMPYSRQVAGVREPNLTIVECLDMFQQCKNAGHCCRLSCGQRKSRLVACSVSLRRTRLDFSALWVVMIRLSLDTASAHLGDISLPMFLIGGEDRIWLRIGEGRQ